MRRIHTRTILPSFEEFDENRFPPTTRNGQQIKLRANGNSRMSIRESAGSTRWPLGRGLTAEKMNDCRWLKLIHVE